MKLCRKCGAAKPLEGFNRKPSCRDGRATVCRDCHNARNAELYRLKREERLAKQKAYYEAHRAERIAYTTDYEKAHAVEMGAYQAHYRDEHREKQRAYDRQHYAATRDQKAAYLRANRERFRDRIRANLNRRKAMQRNAPVSDFTAAQWRAIKEAYGNCCAYCGKELQRLTMDHVIPLVKGGSHTAGNIVPACMACNNRKKAREAPPIVVTPQWEVAQTR